MRVAAPTDVSCQPIGPNIDTSRKYSLVLSAKEPASCQGLRKQKSGYVGVNDSEVFWRRPFGAILQVDQIASRRCSTLTCGLFYSTLLCPTPEVQITITLRQHHKLRPSLDVGTCVVDCSALRGTQSEQSHHCRKSLTTDRKPFKSYSISCSVRSGRTARSFNDHGYCSHR